jgi:hypothetical protein
VPARIKRTHFWRRAFFCLLRPVIARLRSNNNNYSVHRIFVFCMLLLSCFALRPHLLELKDVNREFTAAKQFTVCRNLAIRFKAKT